MKRVVSGRFGTGIQSACCCTSQELLVNYYGKKGLYS